MSVKLKELITTKPKPKKVIAEGFFSKLRSMFGFKPKQINKLKKDRKFKGHISKLNQNWDDLATMIEKDYGQKVKFEKFTIKDFM
tara:strand:- start:724 stop:978 length:255 start_codon:yes stop_codon:yes gene_type:complete